MLRIALFLLLLFAIAIGFAWIADRPGSVTIEWSYFNTQIELTLLTAIVAIAALVAAIMMIWWVISAVIHSPETFGRWRAGRRRDKGYAALSQGLIAVGAGNASLARRLTRESSKLLTSEPMVKMLDAQTSLLEGKREDARKKFESMLENPDTQLLGLRGLHAEAENEANAEAAAHFAKEAYAISPETPWAALGLLKAQGHTGDWADALKTLEANRSNGMFTKEEYKRKRAVVLTALAQQDEDTDPDKAKSNALAAHKLAPAFAPAAVIAARLCIRFSDLKKAARILEASWKLEPHPDIAETYIHLRSGDSALDRLKRAEALAGKRAHHSEGQFAIAHAAIDAGNWKQARSAMEAVLRTTPTEKACLLMADIEEGENGDNGRVREWLSRAVTAPKDAVWTADGVAADQWAPISPITGELDAFEWRVPVEQLGSSAKTLDYSQLEPFVAPPKEEPEETKLIEVPPAKGLGATAAAAATAKAATNIDKEPASEKTPIEMENEPVLETLVLDDEVEDAEIIADEPGKKATENVDSDADVDEKTQSDDNKSSNTPDQYPDVSKNADKDIGDKDTSTNEDPGGSSPFKSVDLDTNEDGLLDVRPDDPGTEKEKPKKRKNFFF